MTKIHCSNPIAKCGMELFSAGYEMTDNVVGADVVPVRSVFMHDMELLENLLAVSRAGAGVNNTPLGSCAQKGIVAFNALGTNANGVKELMIAGMLTISRDIMGGIRQRRVNVEGDSITKDIEKGREASADCETKDKKLEAIGLGAIGAEVTNVATHLGMEVYEYNLHISINAAWRLSRDVKYVTSTDITFQKCDYITIYIPLMDPIRGMVNKEKLATMKDEVVILDLSKDTPVNDDDMVAALDTGKVRYYVSDFPNPKVTSMEGVILLPHLGASTKESKDNYATMVVGELADCLGNSNIKNSVNSPSCDMGICQAESHVAVLHMNIPNVIRQIAAILTEQGMNISDMTNRSRDKYAYTLLDLEHKAEDSTIRKLRAIKGVLRVWMVK